MARRGEVWVSDELREALAKLTAQQSNGVLRIVQAQLEGRPISSLLDCPGQICTSTTYYGSGKRTGWIHKPHFKRALELAQRDYRSWLLDHGVGSALAVLAQAAPEAAQALRQEVSGDRSAVEALLELLKAGDPELRQAAARELGATGLAMVVPALRLALQKEKDEAVQQTLIMALGHVAGWRDGDRRAAATSSLDRADIKTAAKQALALDEEDIDAAIERGLEKLAQDSQAGDVGAAAGEGRTGTG